MEEKDSVELAPLPAGDIRGSSSEQQQHPNFNQSDAAKTLEKQARLRANHHILSVLSLSQWVRTYGARSDRMLHTHTHEETFVDLHGVRRYVHNWQEVSEETMGDSAANRRHFHNTTGCLRRDIHCTTDLETRGTNEESEVVQASFLTDWQRLWHFLENDPEDEIARHAPLFRLAVEFFFHRRTFQIFTWIFIYNNLNLIVLNTVIPFKHAALFTFYEVLTDFLRLVAYYAVFILFRGSLPPLFHRKNSLLFGKQEETEENEEETYPAAEEVNNRVISLSSDSWYSILRQLFASAVLEVPVVYEEISRRDELQRFNSTSLAGRKRSKRNRTFYDLLNIALKFFIRHNGISTKEIRWNRTSYRTLIIFATLVYPFICLIYEIPRYAYMARACEREYNGHDCQFLLYRVSLMLGDLLVVAETTIAAGGVIIALTGLAYGAEMAFRLVDGWIQKFCCLRRLGFDDAEDKCFIVDGDREEDESSHMSESHDNALDSHPSHKIASKSFSTEELIEQKKEIAELISEDATEHYLFLREVMVTADKVWSPVLIGLFVFAGYLIVEYLLYGVMIVSIRRTQDFIRMVCFGLSRFLILVVGPIAFISHANTYIYRLSAAFSVAAPDDYVIIGERDRWVELMKTSPAVWTFFGIWITWDRLFGLVYTAMTGSGVYALTTFVLPLFQQ